MQVVLCPPKYYRIDYIINPWMDKSFIIDQDEVNASYQKLKLTYQQSGLTVLEIDPSPDYPDQVYMANSGWSDGQKFILANYRYTQRRGESALLKDFLLEKIPGLTMYHLPESCYFEGQGEMFQVGEKYFCGYGKRTSLEAINFLEDIVEHEIMALENIDDYFYHLDMSFGPLSDKAVVVNRNAFKDTDFNIIEKNFDSIYVTNDQDNQAFACNFTIVGDKVLISDRISDQLAHYIQDHGLEIVPINIDQWHKGGGGIRCNSLFIPK